MKRTLSIIATAALLVSTSVKADELYITSHDNAVGTIVTFKQDDTINLGFGAEFSQSKSRIANGTTFEVKYVGLQGYAQTYFVDKENFKFGGLLSIGASFGQACVKGQVNMCESDINPLAGVGITVSVHRVNMMIETVRNELLHKNDTVLGIGLLLH